MVLGLNLEGSELVKKLEDGDVEDDGDVEKYGDVEEGRGVEEGGSVEEVEDADLRMTKVRFRGRVTSVV